MIKIILANVFLVVLFIYLNKKIRKGFHILQLEHYKSTEYYKWIKKHLSTVINILEIIFFVIISILSLFYTEIAFVLGIIFTIILYLTIPKQKEKKPLVVTNRIKRMYITNAVIYIIVMIIINITKNIYGIYILLIYTILSYFAVIILNAINSPIEKSVQNKFYKMAQKKLEENKNIKIIGITGSYGKTSTKYIVSTILEQKYNVLMTPESYNTTMGVVRTINENMKNEHQIFVCEMGARHIGDIKEICDLVKPQYGILTSIGPQHLDTFKTIDNVKKTKLELIDSLRRKWSGFYKQ